MGVTTSIAETVLTMLGTSGITYFFTRRMYKKQVEAAHLANEQTASSLWKEFGLDMKAEYAELKIKFDLSQETVEKQSKQIFELQKEVYELKIQFKNEHSSR